MQPKVTFGVIAEKTGIDECNIILQAIVLNHLRYALPMYFKYLASDRAERINAIFVRLINGIQVKKSFQNSK
jgi:hypothetical protein